MKKDINIYSLSREFWNFCFENPEKIKPPHIAVYFLAIDFCNRLGWKTNFSFPTKIVLEAIGIKSYTTYKKAFDDLVNWGFFIVIEYSKNQFSANIISLNAFEKNYKALDNALIMHNDKHMQKHDEYINTNTHYNNNTNTINNDFDFKKALIKYGFEEKLVSDWLEVRKTRNHSNNKTAYEGFIREVEKTGIDKNKILRYCIEKNWSYFESTWGVDCLRTHKPKLAAP